MAFSKAHLFDQFLYKVSQLMRLGSHPERLMIIKLLIIKGPMTVEQITDASPIKQPSVSKHIKKLRGKGVVVYREKHPYIFYSVDEKVLALMEAEILGFFRKLRRKK